MIIIRKSTGTKRNEKNNSDLFMLFLLAQKTATTNAAHANYDIKYPVFSDTGDNIIFQKYQGKL